MGTRPIDRQVVLIGPAPDAHVWASDHQLCGYLIAERPQQLRELDGAGLHLVVLPESRHLAQFLLLQLEVVFLERHGAIVEGL